MYKRTKIVNINKIGVHRNCLDKIDRMSEKFVEEEKNSKMLLSDYNKENQELKKKLEKVNNLLKKYNLSSIQLIEDFLDTWYTFCKDYKINNIDDIINRLDLIKTETEQKQYNESEDSSDSEATDDNDCEPKVSKKEEKYKSPEIIDDSDVNESQEENPETIEVEEKVTNKNIQDNVFENIINNYLNYENHYYPKCVKNTNINTNIEEINVSINKKDIENANIVYNLSIIYNKYLHDNEKDLTFDQFIEYNKEDYIFIDSSNTRIKDRYKRCYSVLENVLQLDKSKVINILSRLKLSYSKIYKLLDIHREKLNLFIIAELGKKDYKDIYITQEPVPDLEMVKTLIHEIPFSYIGNKKSIVKELLNVYYQAKNEKINTFIELYSGSMVLSYIIKHMLPNIKIHCYENNPYLINFYKYIKQDVAEFILDIEDKLEIISKTEKKDSYIKNILKNINNLTEKDQGSWYFIFINVSHRNILSYKLRSLSSITFNENAFKYFKDTSQKDTFIKKIKKYAEFINKIEIHDININENYNEILKTIGKDAITYIDPPYYGANSNKIYYSNFTITNQINLCNFVNDLSKKELLFIQSNSNTFFINNLYNNFNINKINVNSKLKYREELIITNFKYSS